MSSSRREVLETAAAGDAIAELLIPVLEQPTGLSSAGFPYLQQSAWETFRDRVPHLFGMGQRVLEACDRLSAAFDRSDASPEDRETVRNASTVVRQVALTATITAPPDLWLLRHVLGAFADLGLLQRLLQGEAEHDRERGGRGDEGRDVHAEARAEQDHQDEATDNRSDHVAKNRRGLPRPARAGQEVEDHDLHDLERAVREREEAEETEIGIQERGLRRLQHPEQRDAPGQGDQRERERQAPQRGAAADDADDGNGGDQRQERRYASPEEIDQRSAHAGASGGVGSEPKPSPPCIDR